MVDEDKGPNLKGLHAGRDAQSEVQASIKYLGVSSFKFGATKHSRSSNSAPRFSASSLPSYTYKYFCENTVSMYAFRNGIHRAFPSIYLYAQPCKDPVHSLTNIDSAIPSGHC